MSVDRWDAAPSAAPPRADEDDRGDRRAQLDEDGIEPMPSTEHASAVLPLDGLTQGIDPLDALVVVTLADASVHAAWVRESAGLGAVDIAREMREAYRASLQASRKLAIFAATTSERGQVAEPILTMETLARTAILKRVRGFVVIALFDASLPLGMARLLAARLVAALEPELPLTDIERLTLPPFPTGSAEAADGIAGQRWGGGLATGVGGRLTDPWERPSQRPRMPGVPTFGASGAMRAPPNEVARVRAILAYLESELPDPHLARPRISLAARVPRITLDHLETLSSETVRRVEAAAAEMLGLDLGDLVAQAEGAGRSAGPR